MKIICLGDSLTAGCGLRRGENWVELLREQTGDEWINAGVCGDTSTGILVRLQTEVLPQRPDEVLLMGGDNDIMLTGCADQAKSAMLELGIAPKVQPIRGGTDGARLSFLGLPCPNLCAGGENFHGRFEYVPVEDMEKITKLLATILWNIAK